ncbi:MAG: hypothetical protein HWN80_09665 [Candidatus Lokiarchaeota archaeon]|nr:hypothetical protein [Candidatus Lokiarchaeota archaeon]
MRSKIKTFISINLLILSILIACSNQPNIVYAQSNGDSLTADVNYRFQEFSNFSTTQFNTNHIKISLPGSKWNVTNLELNITDIKLGEEVKSIEEADKSFKSVYKGVRGYGVQLNITEDITLIGVQIFGYLFGTTYSSVYVQINGYNQVNHRPNATIYGNPGPINISTTPGWYVQKFPEPISLSKGYYYLVVNGSEYKSYDNSDHNWAYNASGSIHTNLYTSKYISGVWLDDVMGEPFSHKLIQRTDQSFDPEAINMTIKVDDTIYTINNSSPGSGKVQISNVNIPLNQTDVVFPVYHNRTIELMFNVSYDLKLENHFTSPGTIEIAETHDNYWSVTPILAPEFNNYSVKFNFPSKWFDVSLLRNEVNITGLVDVNHVENYIYISNSFISEGDSWEITASSSKKDFNLDVSRTEFYPGQELKFFIATPVLEGNYTFVLTDTYETQINITTKLIPPESNSFAYTFPSNALDGSYKVFVYWLNGTDAGIVTQVFTVILPEVIDWAMIIGIVIIVGLSSAVTVSSVVLAKRNKKKKIAAKEKIMNKFMDILNLNYVIIIEKKSSLNIYDQAFTEKKFNSTLVSGFLEAIRSFGLDISTSEEHSQTIKLEYQNSKILMSDFKHFRLIFIMKDLPSPQFYEIIDDLSLEIEEKYGIYLKEFKGNLQPFEGIESLLRTHMGTTFLYPLKLTGTGKMKIAPTEKSLINKAITIMKKNRLDYFYVTQLIREITFDSKEIEALYSLIIKRIFNPFIL